VTSWIDALEDRLTGDLAPAVEWASPIALARGLDESYVLRDHLLHISDRLTHALHDVEGGQSRYLAISVPPRHGKSLLLSVYFPLWVFHRHPDWPLMLLSHDPTLAAGWGRHARRLIEEHGERFGVALAADAGAAKEWETTEGGVMLSRSIRESVTGRGAKVMLIDDPVKDFAEAHSPVSRDFVWDWWLANSRTRLHPPSLVVTIMTRWHEDDFVGRLLSNEYEGDPAAWEVISLPALAEDPEATDPRTKKPFGPDILGRSEGEPLLSPLNPAETTEEALSRWADVRRGVGSYVWQGLYQQRPSSAKGSVFEADWWQYWRPGDLDGLAFERRITSWDCAFKSTKESDWVVGQEWGVAGADRYLLRQVRRRLSFTETLAVMEDFIATSGAHEHIVEDKANGTAVIDVLKARIPGLIPINPTDSKEARARAITPEVEAGNVYLPALADWLPDFLSEMRAFPNAPYDDQVDATSQALTRLRRLGTVTPFVPTGKVQRGRVHSRARRG
jgi:predicted phage terminase large subunit-like protein